MRAILPCRGRTRSLAFACADRHGRGMIARLRVAFGHPNLTRWRQRSQGLLAVVGVYRGSPIADLTRVRGTTAPEFRVSGSTPWVYAGFTPHLTRVRGDASPGIPEFRVSGFACVWVCRVSGFARNSGCLGLTSGLTGFDLLARSPPPPQRTARITTHRMSSTASIHNQHIRRELLFLQQPQGGQPAALFYAPPTLELCHLARHAIREKHRQISWDLAPGCLGLHLGLHWVCTQ